MSVKCEHDNYQSYCVTCLFEENLQLRAQVESLSKPVDGYVLVPIEPTDEIREILRAIKTHTCHVDSAYKSILHLAISQPKGE